MVAHERSRKSSSRKRKRQPESEDEAMEREEETYEKSDSSTSTSDEDEEGEDWITKSDIHDEDEEEEKTGTSKCVFCGGGEDEDPNEEYEDMLECQICSEAAHRQCARDTNGPGRLDEQEENETEPWRCPGCFDLVLEEARPQKKDRRQKTTLTPRNRNSRIRADQSQDGSGQRHLRKRKSGDSEDSVKATRSRRRSSSQLHRDHTPIGDGIDNASAKIRTSGRPRKIRNPDGFPMLTVQRSASKIILKMRFAPEKLRSASETQPRDVISLPTTGSIRRSSRALNTVAFDTLAANSIFKALQPTQLSQTSYSNYTYEHYVAMDDEKQKPYGGILADADADTSKTLPLGNDSMRFDKAKQDAEDDKKKRAAASAVTALITDKGTGNDDTRNAVAQNQSTGNPKALSSASKIQHIHFGSFEIDTWYAAPYPEEYSRNKILYICEFCLKYMNSEYISWRHKMKCPSKHPPGDEIYRDRSVSIFEVDGRKNPGYCRNLCLLAKLFLGSKTLYYDVEPFLFYVMTECDDTGCHFVGYFSKEKRSTSQNNVSCILTLPIHQRKGYGNLLIDFSYLLTRTEGKAGSPEKPLSDLGLVSYRNYWKLMLCYELRNHGNTISIKDLSSRTGMTADDIISGLENLHALVRDPVTKTYAIRHDKDLIQAYINKWENKNYIKLNPEALTWTPFIMGRQHHLNNAPPTIAPRDTEPQLESGVLVEEQGIINVTETATPSEQTESHTPATVAGVITLEAMDVDQTSEPVLHVTTNADKKRSSPSRIKLTPPEELYIPEGLYTRPIYLPPTKTTMEESPVKSQAPSPRPQASPSKAQALSSKSSMPLAKSPEPAAQSQTASIPLTRFQIFPPLPVAPRKAKHHGTPSKAKTAVHTPSSIRRKDALKVQKPSSSLRRTRSGLLEPSETIERQSPRLSSRSKNVVNGDRVVASPDLVMAHPATPAFTNGSIESGDVEGDGGSRDSSPVISDIPGVVTLVDVLPKKYR